MNERVNPFKKLQKPGKHVKRIVIGAAGLVIIAGLAGDATYQIQEQEQAVLTTFGVPKAVAETGLHFKIPFIQKVQKVNTTIQGFPIGYSMGDNSVVENEGIMITSDYNFIDVDFFVESSDFLHHLISANGRHTGNPAAGYRIFRFLPVQLPDKGHSPHLRNSRSAGNRPAAWMS